MKRENEKILDGTDDNVDIESKTEGDERNL